MSDPSSDTLPAELQHKFSAIRQWQFISRVATVLTLVVVVGMFAVFTRTTYDGVQANFKDDARNQKALAKALPRVTPLVTRAVTTVLSDAAPVYQQLAAERYQKIRDNLGSKTLIRLHQLPQESGQLLSTRLTAVFERVLKQIEPDLRATFPSLTDAQRRDLLVDYFGTMIEQRNKAIAMKIDAVRVTEMARIDAILSKFEIAPDDAGPGSDQLHKELVRTMLLLAEQELSAMDPVRHATISNTAGNTEASIAP